MYTVWPSENDARSYAYAHGGGRRGYQYAQVGAGPEWAAWREGAPVKCWWDGSAECWDHSDRCARCGYVRPYARLTQANRARREYAPWPDHARICRDECEGRPIAG